jgi:hypothetical protein
MKQIKVYIIAIVVSLLLLFLYLYKIGNIEGFSGVEEKKTAIIVEPREHKALKFVLHNFLENLPDNWSIIIMHGNKNEKYVKDIIENDLDSFKDRITTVNLFVNNLTLNEYNELLKSRKFYDNIPTELFLIFQTDAVICGENKDLINDFEKYDYVGAPWKDAVGNGGLSLRRKSKMLEIIEKCPQKDENEDIYFANPCVDIYKPSIEEAKLFSVEKIHSNISFGVHKAWSYLNDSELNDKIEHCKSLKELIKLNQ